MLKLKHLDRVLSRPPTVEHEPGWGWIARDPETRAEILPGHRWPSRQVARDVVAEARIAADIAENADYLA